MSRFEKKLAKDLRLAHARERVMAMQVEILRAEVARLEEVNKGLAMQVARVTAHRVHEKYLVQAAEWLKFSEDELTK